MADFYERLTENLGKLQRNESQMTEEQKKQYAAPLKKLKNQIAEDATEAMKQFITMGMRIAKEDKNPEDWKNVIRATEKLIEEYEKSGGIKKASKILFTTYSLDKFFEALCDIHSAVFHLAYGGYWIKHITPTGEKEYPFYNDIIEMYWWAEHHEWAATKIEDGKRVTDYYGGVTIMLPPTWEEIKAEHDKEVRESA